jgi:hypothetical protein
MFDRLTAFLERLGPRERRLAGWLGVVFVVVAIGYVGMLINDGLSNLEKQNSNMRLLLASLGERRDQLTADKSKEGQVAAMIGDEAPALGTYVEKIAGENGVQIRQQSEKPAAVKGRFRELANEITLYDVSVEQLAKLLHGLETTNPTVVTQKLDIKRSIMQKEKLDRVVITVATYERAKAPKEKAAAEAPAAPPAEVKQ